MVQVGAVRPSCGVVIACAHCGLGPSAALRGVVSRVVCCGTTNNRQCRKSWCVLCDMLVTRTTTIMVHWLQVLTHRTPVPAHTHHRLLRIPAPPHTGRLSRIPQSRIKSIMRADPEVTIVANDATFAVTRCTELVVQYLTTVAADQMKQSGKRKTIKAEDIRACFIPPLTCPHSRTSANIC